MCSTSSVSVFKRVYYLPSSASPVGSVVDERAIFCKKGSIAPFGKTRTTTGPWSATTRNIIQPRPFMAWLEWWLDGYRWASGSAFCLSHHFISARARCSGLSRRGYCERSKRLKTGRRHLCQIANPTPQEIVHQSNIVSPSGTPFRLPQTRALSLLQSTNRSRNTSLQPPQPPRCNGKGNTVMPLGALPLPLSDVERKTKSMQTTHTIRALPHQHGLCRTRRRRSRLLC